MTNLSKSFFASSAFSLLDWTVMLSCALMFTGFLCSRVFLSVGMIMLICAGFRPHALKEGWRLFRENTFGWLALVFFCFYLISGFWSLDREQWLAAAQIKLPFALMPFALMNLPFDKKRLQVWLISIILVILFAGIAYSSSFLVMQPQRFFSKYHLPSPVGRDYIRFTIALVLAMQMILFVLSKKNQFNIAKPGRILMISWMIIAALYIHVQAAKSGLLCFYLLVAVNVGYRFVRNRQFGLWKALGILLVGVLLLFFSVRFLPSVNNQISRVKNGLAIWQSGDTAKYETNSSIIPRLVSYEAAWKSIQKHPLGGIGAGDWEAAVQHQYELYFPFMKKYRLIPHNQFICTAFLVGIPAAVVLILMVLWPLRRIPDVAVLSTVCIMIAGTMIEAMLEIQYGVFVYLFFILFWLSALRKEPGKTKATGAI
ncbi:MAG TPA: O-antigen ligase family protein [Edaphocola sp.]|nr:O-antigen ligase family protein [Edaphocola sp.]